MKATKNNIIIAAQIVKSGRLVVYPTETVYGLGCDPMNIQAVKQIIEVKGDRKKHLPILAANIKDVEMAAVVSSNGKKLDAKFWPGPLIMVFPKKPALPSIVTFGLDSVGLWISNNDVALQFSSLSGGLLVGSSSNRTGEEPLRSVQEISMELKRMVDVVLEGGTAVHGISSTVTDLTSDKPKILRECPISLQAILDVLAFCD